MSKVECKCRVSERDMDMLFLQAFATEQGLADLFVSKKNRKDSKKCISFQDNYKVKQIVLSKTDAELGESDITVIIESGKKKYALLIEDKIDAIPMPKQHERYMKRGELGKKRQEYDEFYDFIVCPKKYTEGSNESSEFSFLVTYEECRDFFEQSSCPMKEVWIQQIDEALSKSKATSKVMINEAANRFLGAYANYLKSNGKYKKLNFKTNLKSNGWWIHFGTESSAYIYHKTQEGEVELILNATSAQMLPLKHMVQLINRYIDESVDIKKAGKSLALVKRVTPLDISKESFENIDKTIINECLDAVLELSDIADMMLYGKELI